MNNLNFQSNNVNNDNINNNQNPMDNQNNFNQEMNNEQINIIDNQSMANPLNNNLQNETIPNQVVFNPAVNNLNIQPNNINIQSQSNSNQVIENNIVNTPNEMPSNQSTINSLNNNTQKPNDTKKKPIIFIIIGIVVVIIVALVVGSKFLTKDNPNNNDNTTNLPENDQSNIENKGKENTTGLSEYSASDVTFNCVKDDSETNKINISYSDIVFDYEDNDGFSYKAIVYNKFELGYNDGTKITDDKYKSLLKDIVGEENSYRLKDEDYTKDNLQYTETAYGWNTKITRNDNKLEITSYDTYSPDLDLTDDKPAKADKKYMDEVKKSYEDAGYTCK